MLQRIIAYLEGLVESGALSITALDARVTAAESDIAALEAVAQKATSTGSGANFDFTGITTDSAMFILEGISHNAVSESWQISYSTNNGGGWTLVGSVSSAAADANVTDGVIDVRGLLAGRAIGHSAVSASGFPATTLSRPFVMNPGAQINGFRISPTGGSIDAGTVRLMTPGGL